MFDPLAPEALYAESATLIRAAIMFAAASGATRDEIERAVALALDEFAPLPIGWRRNVCANTTAVARAADRAMRRFEVSDGR